MFDPAELLKELYEKRDASPTELDVILAQLRPLAKRAVLKRTNDPDTCAAAVDRIMEAAHSYDGRDPTKWFEKQIAYALSAEETLYREDDREQPADTLATMLREDVSAHGGLDMLAKTAHEVWRTNFPSTARDYLDAYFLNPDMISRLADAHNSPEKRVFVDRLRAFAGIVGRDYDEYKSVLEKTGFTKDGTDVSATS